MREVRPGEVPWDGGTALQEDPDRPAFHGVGPDDYVCVGCGTVLAESMHAEQMTYKVRVKCARCRTVNVAAHDEPPPPKQPRAHDGPPSPKQPRRPGPSS